MCGGGGPSGDTKYNWNDDMAPFWRRALGEGEALSNQPYQRYGGQRIAGINQDQTRAMDSIRHFYGMSGNDATQAAYGGITDTLGGRYLTGGDANPYSDMTNPWRNISIDVEGNQFMGESDAYRDMMRAGMEDITGAYERGTAADTASQFALAGAFGGSAHQDAMSNNQANLMKQLTSYSRQMENDQFNRSAQLREADISRRLQNDQLFKTQGGNWDQETIGRGNQNWESERNRMMGAITPGQNEQALALQRFNAMMGVGDVNRGYTQDLLNQGYNDWQEEQQNPYKQMDWLTGLFSRAQGGMSPNSSFSQSGYSASPFSQVLGAGLLGKGFGLY